VLMLPGSDKWGNSTSGLNGIRARKKGILREPAAASFRRPVQRNARNADLAGFRRYYEFCTDRAVKNTRHDGDQRGYDSATSSMRRRAAIPQHRVRYSGRGISSDKLSFEVTPSCHRHKFGSLAVHGGSAKSARGGTARASTGHAVTRLRALVSDESEPGLVRASGETSLTTTLTASAAVIRTTRRLWSIVRRAIRPETKLRKVVPGETRVFVLRHFSG